MDSETMLATLLDLAEEVGVIVRPMPAAVDESQHRGGSLVRLRGKSIFFLNDLAETAEQVDALAQALRSCKELQERFLPPEIRELLDRP